jgi:hypothetical protein
MTQAPETKLNKRDIGGPILELIAAFDGRMPEELEATTLAYAGHVGITYPDAKAGVKVAEDALTEAQKREAAADVKAFVTDAFPPRDAADVKLNTTLIPKREADVAKAKRKAIAAGYASRDLARDMNVALRSPETSLAIERIYLELFEAVNGDHGDLTFRAVTDMRAQAVRALPLIERVYLASVAEGITPQERKRLGQLWQEFGPHFPSLAVVRDDLYGEAQAKVVEDTKADAERKATERAALQNASAMAAAQRQGMADVAVVVAAAEAKSKDTDNQPTNA